MRLSASSKISRFVSFDRTAGNASNKLYFSLRIFRLAKIASSFGRLCRVFLQTVGIRKDYIGKCKLLTYKIFNPSIVHEQMVQGYT